MIKQSLYALAGAAVIGASFVGSAEAQVSCDVSNFTQSIDCEGAFSGNATPDIPGNTYFGISDWTEILKVNSDSGTDSGSGGFLEVTGGGTSGGYSLTGLDAGHQYMVALKGGPSFSVYLLEAGITDESGSWNTDGLFKGNGKPGPGLSNVTVWKTRIAPPPPERIPEPISTLAVFAFGAVAAGGALKKKLSA